MDNSGNPEKAKMLGRVSLALNIAAIISAVVFFFLYILILPASAASSASSSYYGYYRYYRSTPTPSLYYRCQYGYCYG